MLAGARVPFVLRQVNDAAISTEEMPFKRFECVGETYVHGIMNGEALQGKSTSFERIDLV